MTAGGSYWPGLRARGWEPWSRGHGLDEKTLTWVHRVFRRAPQRGGPAHALVRVPVEFREGRFRAGAVRFVDELGREVPEPAGPRRSGP